MTPPVTTVQILTAPGTGAIALLRLTGPDSHAILQRVFRPKHGSAAPRLHALRYGEIVDSGETLDDVIVTFAEFSGNAAVDIAAHGGVRVVERILSAMERAGATFAPARAQSAWSCSNRIEAEAIDALTRVKTARAAAFLAWQRTHLPAALMTIADKWATQPHTALQELHAIDSGYEIARALVDGVTIGLLGPPNSGKSTIFNRLVGRPAAVVSPVPGTTRDWVTAEMEIDGFPVTLVDTAGRHETSDALEHDALTAGERRLASIDLALVVLDSADTPPPNMPAITQAARNAPRTLWVLNKSDLAPRWNEESLRADPQLPSTVRVSAQSGGGWSQLIQAISDSLRVNNSRAPIAPALFTTRQTQKAQELADLATTGTIEAIAHFVRNHLICFAKDTCQSRCL